MDHSGIAVSIRSISKTYKLFENPIDRVKEAFSPFRKNYSRPFHALKNFSAEIGWGETVAIVGRNGCGKSTLLQIVCGIIPPTSGSLLVKGRISAILELGAGFNPEFTGRDNIYLNCSILGFKRKEVNERIDDILKFADIGQFIDQPVKTYSSGMAVRLAFSIAINVDPDILVVDEALAVGDSAFQRKCFSKIRSIQKNGATILFVSHDAGSVVELCDRAILLDQGELIYSGSPKKVVSFYHKLLFSPEEKTAEVRNSILKSITSDSEIIKGHDTSSQFGEVLIEDDSKSYLNPHLVPKTTNWYEPNGARIADPHVQTANGKKVNMLVRNVEYYFCYRVKFDQDAFNIRFCMLIKTVTGFDLGGYGNWSENDIVENLKTGSIANVKLKFICSLLPGTYFLNAGVLGVLKQNDVYLHRGVDVIMFEVLPEKNLGQTALVDFGIKPIVEIIN